MKYPNLRNDLKEYLGVLSDTRYQQKHWIENLVHQEKEGDTFDMFIHFWFDDMALSEEPEKCIGIFLKNAEESNVIKEITFYLESMFNEFGLEASVVTYLQSSQWKEVIRLAYIAKSIIFD